MALNAIILGSGAQVGRAVANKLVKEGYRVAIGSRNPDIETLKRDGLHGFAIDLYHAENVVPALEAVEREFCAPPDVVVYNGESAL